MSSITLRKASGSAPRAGTTSTDRIEPACGRNFLEPARQAGQIGLRAWSAAGDRKLAALHRGIRPAQTAAGKHRIGEIGRRAEAGDADVEALRADGLDRHQRHPHHQVEILLDPNRGRRQRVAGALEIGGRHRKAGAIAAEHERKFAPFERVGDGGDHGRRRPC